MTTSMDSTKPVTTKIFEHQIECTDFIISKDRHAITVSMSIKNIGQSNLLISVNNFCLIHNRTEFYAQHCYISDGQSFEVISGWKSLSKHKNYTIITKYAINPNLPMYDLYYKSTQQQYLIVSLEP